MWASVALRLDDSHVLQVGLDDGRSCRYTLRLRHASPFWYDCMISDLLGVSRSLRNDRTHLSRFALGMEIDEQAFWRSRQRLWTP